MTDQEIDALVLRVIDSEATAAMESPVRTGASIKIEAEKLKTLNKIAMAVEAIVRGFDALIINASR